MDELNKIGDINNVGDILDFKLSIKTIAIMGFFWGCFCIFAIIILFGGVDNTIKYFTGLLSSAKKSIIDNKNKRDSERYKNKNGSSNKEQEQNKKRDE